jgi:hypothetical protein
MNWLHDRIIRGPRNFDQDLDLFCSRWMDPSRKFSKTMTTITMAAALRAKADQLEGKGLMRESQGA